MNQNRLSLMALLVIVALFTVQCTSSAVPTPTSPPPADTPVPPTPVPEPEEAALPKATGVSLFTYVTDTSAYSEWGTWPADDFNDFSGLLTSGAPHGGIVRIFVNDVALAAAEDFTGELPLGSIILKENYTGTMVDEPGDLDALTIMYKVEGYNPDQGDWYWLKVLADGTIAAEGKVAGCIGCHGQANNKDYVLRYGFGEEPAVRSQGQ